jgi:hypothetical protein
MVFIGDLAQHTQPSGDFIQRGFVDPALQDAGPLGHFQRMVTAFDDVEGCAEVMLLNRGANLFGAAEGVT